MVTLVVIKFILMLFIDFIKDWIYPIILTIVGSGILVNWIQKRGKVILADKSVSIHYYPQNFANHIGSFYLNLKFLNKSGTKKHVAINQVRYFDGEDYHLLYFNNLVLKPSFDIEGNSSYQETYLMQIEETLPLPVLGFVSQNVSFELRYSVDNKPFITFIENEQISIKEDWLIL